MPDILSEGNRSKRKALALLILLMTTITPLSLTVVQIPKTTGYQQTSKIAPNQRQEINRMLGPLPPTLAWKYQTGGPVVSSPAVADLFGNGKLEVVVGSFDYNIYCLNATTGNKLWSFKTGSYIHSSPVVADLNGDGRLEVVVGSEDDNVYCLDGLTGAEVWSYRTGNLVYSSAIVADLFGDGKLAVVAGSYDCSIYCLNASGTKVWSYKTGGYIYSSPIVADLFGNGKLEVLAGSGDGNLYCLDGQTGSKIWNYTTGGWVTSPVAADLFGNGQEEVIVGSEDSYVYCLNGTTGKKIWSFSPDLYALQDSPIAVADVLGNGKLEIVVVSNDWNVYCLSATGSRIWSYGINSSSHSSPVIADLYGNGKLEVVIGSGDNNVYCLDGSTGNELWNYGADGAVYSSPVAADLLGDGKFELAFGSYDGGVYCINLPFKDTTPPATVTNLAATNPTDNSTTLTWTAPGNDGMAGNATGYVLKYSTQGCITASNWSSAETYVQTWTPAKGGTNETHMIMGLSPGTTYWFAIEAYDSAANYNNVSNSPHVTTLDGAEAGWSSSLITIVGVVILPAVASTILVAIFRKRRGKVNTVEAREYTETARIGSKARKGVYPQEVSPDAKGHARRERISIDELSVSGTTLKVYWSLLGKRPDSVGFRDVQREVGFSSPSSALYQLDKLVRLGLLEKDAMGDYTLRRIVKIGLLNNFFYIGKYSIPKNAVYGFMTLLINSICIALMMAIGLSPVAYLTLIPGMFSSVVFFYEASKAWRYKRKVFEAADSQSEQQGVMGNV